jgi:hypothetical protein
MHARYYSAALGRFLCVDPVKSDPKQPQSWNRYAYVTNNPMNQTDPSGKCGEGANLVGPTQPCDFGLHAEIGVTAKDPGFIASTIFLVQETTAQLTPFGLLPATNEGLWKAYQDRQFLKAHPDWRPSVYADPVVIGLVNTGPISMDEAVSQGAAHVGGEGVVETTAKGTNLQFRNTTTNAAGQRKVE